MIRALLLAAALVPAAAFAGAEPMETSLWRSVALGRLESVDPQQIVDYLRDSPDQAGYLLGRAALAVAGEPNSFPEWPLTRLLDEHLDSLRPGSCHCDLAENQGPLPAGFGPAQQLFTLVYALVMTGEEKQATEILGERLRQGTGSDRDLTAQALAFIGTPEAKALIRGYAEDTGSAVANNLLGARYFPTLHDLAGYQRLIPAEDRGRDSLLRIVQQGRSDRELLALHLLGLLPPAADPEQEQREIDLLRRGSASGHFGYRYVATRSLGLRTGEDPPFWIRLYGSRPEDPWLRALVVQIAFTRLGTAFAPAALELLGSEPSQYVQWRLLHGLLAAWSRHCLFTPMDLWLRSDLQLLIDCRGPDRGELPPEAITEVLDWLDADQKPADTAVVRELIYRLVGGVRGDDSRRVLRHWWALVSDQPRAWWMLAALRDPGALPLLRYWLASTDDRDGQAILADLIAKLERTGPGKRARRPCCDPDPHCLREHVEVVAAPEVVASAEQAEGWLRSPARSSDLEIRFLDPSGRAAEVALGTGKAERWEHLYGCWVRVEQAPPAPSAIREQDRLSY